MKKPPGVHPVLLVIGIVVVLALLLSVAHNISEKANANPVERPSVYAQMSTVTTINYDRGFVGFTDDHSRELYLYHTYGWTLGDLALCAVDDNGTDYLYDDFIISATYYVPTPAPIA